jgi:hypothetical protein
MSYDGWLPRCEPPTNLPCSTRFLRQNGRGAQSLRQRFLRPWKPLPIPESRVRTTREFDRHFSRPHD